MQDKASVSARGQKSFVIFATPAQEDLSAAFALMREAGISMRGVKNILELGQILMNSAGAMGIIIEQKFLGEDALVTLEKIKSIDPELPVVIMASNTSIAFEKAVRRMGIFYYMISPYDQEEFLNIVCALNSDNTRRKDVRKLCRTSRTKTKRASSPGQKIEEGG